MSLPTIALTLGDVAGIGPEVVVRACTVPEVHGLCRPVVVGHPQIVRRAAALIGSSAQVLAGDAPEHAEPAPERIVCITAGDDAVLAVPAGVVDARAGDAAYTYLVTAGQLALAGRVDAITTAPLNKAALHAAGRRYPGHTEILAELAGPRDYAMMLYLDRRWLPERHGAAASATQSSGSGGSLGGLAVVHVTLHVRLSEVPRRITTDAVLRTIRLSRQAVGEMRAGEPRIGVAALNPHAGEGGGFGDEEERVIAPAVHRAKAEGMDVTGPLPADTLLARAAAGEFDTVVAMYHDQGHIALKLLGMHRAVNVTLGLPLVRTSPAHGTAPDIAWQGRAESTGMVEAIRVAAALAGRRVAAR